MILPAMAQSAITAILSGAMLFVLGMIPGLLAGLAEGLRNFRDHFLPPGRPYRNIQADSRVSGEIWLVLVGGTMRIIGLLALLSG
jgi:hypothetical protein